MPLQASTGMTLPALALTLGVVFFAMVTAILLVRTRRNAADMEASFRNQINALTAEVDRANALLLSEPQIVVAWAAAAEEPDIIGDIGIVTSATMPQRVLAFGGWLPPAAAQAMERAVEGLRARGEAFSMALTTLGGKSVEADGRAIGGRAVMRLRDVSGIKSELATLDVRHRELLRDMTRFAHADRRTAISGLGSRRRRASRFRQRRLCRTRWRPSDATDAIERGLEVLDRAARDEAARVRAPRGRLIGVACLRSSPERGGCSTCWKCATGSGSAGVGIDATEVESVRANMARVVDAHRRTLDQLATGVAIFARRPHTDLLQRGLPLALGSR